MAMPRAPQPEWIDEAVALYASGTGTRALAEKYGCAPSNVWEKLRRAGVTLRPVTKYTTDETFFDEIDTEAKAYFLGLMYADGYVSLSNRNFEITLIEEDRPLLERFAAALNHTGPLANRAPKNKRCLPSVRLSVSSRLLVNALAAKGCGPRKSKTLTFPHWVRGDLKHHFVRGYFDGDGHASIGKKPTQGRKHPHANCGMVGTESFCRDVSAEFVKAFGKPGCIRKSPLCDMFYILFCGNGRASLLADYLYRDATIMSDRKHRVMMQAKTFAAQTRPHNRWK